MNKAFIRLVAVIVMALSFSNISAQSLGGLGDMLSGLANKFGVGSSSLTVDKMVGTWKYSSPAVSFQSDNLLMKAGGAAAASQIESKLATYYKTAGFNTLELTIKEDSTFTFKAKLANMSGTITRNESTGNFVFQFKALGMVNLGSMDAYIVMNGDKMELTFDVSKLMSLLEMAGKITKNSTINTVSSLLNKYDGIRAGFKLTKQK